MGEHRKMTSIIPNNVKGRCYICGYWGTTQEHHMIHGTANRKNADHYGLTVQLCPRCHMNLHDHGDYDKDLQRVAQQEFEKRWGHKEWMKVFQKSYL